MKRSIRSGRYCQEKGADLSVDFKDPGKFQSLAYFDKHGLLMEFPAVY